VGEGSAEKARYIWSQSYQQVKVASCSIACRRSCCSYIGVFLRPRLVSHETTERLEQKARVVSEMWKSTIAVSGGVSLGVVLWIPYVYTSPMGEAFIVELQALCNQRYFDHDTSSSMLLGSSKRKLQFSLHSFYDSLWISAPIKQVTQIHQRRSYGVCIYIYITVTSIACHSRANFCERQAVYRLYRWRWDVSRHGIALDEAVWWPEATDDQHVLFEAFDWALVRSFEGDSLITDLKIVVFWHSIN
jgi:hypothetical protein